MRGAVFVETLRRTWKQTIYWGIGLGTLGAFMALALPLLDAIDFIGLVESMPPAFLGALGVGDDVSVLATRDGLMATAYFNRFMLVFVVYPVIMGLRVSVNEEDEGILDMMLSLPLSRGWLLLEKVAAYIVTLPFLAAFILGGIWLGNTIADTQLDMAIMTQLVIALLPVLIFLLCITVLLGALIGRRNIAVATITGFVILSFAIFTVGSMASDSFMADVANVSFFNYYNAIGVMQSGLSVTHLTVLLGLALAGIVVALWRFQTRDVNV
ncbi:ABC transporter permease subunit [Phototrophicus methaneseepsis]|uniref:ABC transporter permease subunit n=1 Tax=Phototrophicus methaneseepsis TaxID=2710758 RepID=A0A7S8IGL2_9CHLR|nr:ABC transporter permease subunit [Phototrophicus methaneseepsis]QPC84779.1 ABC transporter permease subunit [Phototrophicus methaneseepsis]